MDDLTLLALCVWDEAQGEPDDGKAAVARVVINRMARRYSSDGTVAGTVLRKDQFSGFWFAMVDRRYVRVCRTLAQARERADLLLTTAQAMPRTWAKCRMVAEDVLAGKWLGSDAYKALGTDAVLYFNPALSQPSWAAKSRYLTTIGHHAFYAATAALRAAPPPHWRIEAAQAS